MTGRAFVLLRPVSFVLAKAMRTQRFLLAGLVIAAFGFPLLAQPPAAAEQGTKEEKEIDLIWGLKIPMRDGVQLNATVYKPKEMREPLPVLFVLTPYISDSSHGRAYYFAQNGYVSVMVDVRGRGNSGGAFEPHARIDGRDGYDIVEWLALQPWSNGKVAMWGGSYRAGTQWKTLKAFPPHLATIFPIMGGMSGPWERNNISGGNISWLTGVSGVTNNWNLSREWSFWQQKYREWYLEHRPLRELDKIVSNPSPIFQKWLDHPVPDAYWDAFDPTVDDYKRINIPILTMTGHYDSRQRGALEYYRRHMAYGTPEGREKHYVIIGPWDHGGRVEFGGLKFGEASLFDWNKLRKAWYDWTLKDGPKPELLQKRVAYYVAGPGAEEWKYADSLEAIATEKRTLYLDSEGRANDAFHSGFLSEQKPSQSPPDHYVYDPLDVRPAELQRERVQKYMTDQRYALNLFGNGLVYHSETFPEATEITGSLKFVAWMAMDVPDTDFRVDVYEIQPDGTSIPLTRDRMRARYRESLRQEKLVQPGEINRYEFNSFSFFSRRIAKGSRLRLLLGSPNSLERWMGISAKNYNSGGVVAEESGKDARTAHITLYHDAEHPSFLELPRGEVSWRWRTQRKIAKVEEGTICFTHSCCPTA